MTRSHLDAPAVSDPVRHAYREFQRGRAACGEDAYYGEEKVRFAVRDDDVLLAAPDLVIEPSECGVRLVSAQVRARVEVCGVSVSAARDVVKRMDGTNTAVAVRRSAGSAVDEILESGFGTVVFAPISVSALERRLSVREIARYPGSPYEVVRPYWENMVDVAEASANLDAAARDRDRFLDFVRSLHVLALVGASGRSFYAPASPIVGKGALVPGELLSERPVIDESGSEAPRFVSGPRVNASLLGGAAYQELLAESLGDRGALFEPLVFGGEVGPSWGRIVRARAEADAGPAPWFCPPRPMTVPHVEALRTDLSSALSRGGELDALARFHQRLVRLHPFPAGNQSVGMSLVNAVLRRSRGSGIPHLVLDHLALRFSEPAYAKAFRLAVEGWLVTSGSAADRLLALSERRREVFSLVRDLASTSSSAEAAALARSRRDAARWALIDI